MEKKKNFAIDDLAVMTANGFDELRKEMNEGFFFVGERDRRPQI